MEIQKAVKLLQNLQKDIQSSGYLYIMGDTNQPSESYMFLLLMKTDHP
jgi:hypothetical protein